MKSHMHFMQLLEFRLNTFVAHSTKACTEENSCSKLCLLGGRRITAFNTLFQVFRATVKLGQRQPDLLNWEHAASVSMDVRKLIKGHSS